MVIELPPEFLIYRHEFPKKLIGNVWLDHLLWSTVKQSCFVFFSPNAMDSWKRINSTRAVASGLHQCYMVGRFLSEEDAILFRLRLGL